MSETRTQTVEEEIQCMDEEIARLEAERAELEGPPQEIGWDELVAKSAKYERELEARERRRGILPRLLSRPRRSSALNSSVNIISRR